MSSDKCEYSSVVEDASFESYTDSNQSKDHDDAVFQNSSSSLSSDDMEVQVGAFFIGYNYMATLSMLDLSTRSRGAKFYCYLCDYCLHTRLSMITHMKMHRVPFCPACFTMFHRALDVNYHMAEQHAEITQIEGAPVLFVDEIHYEDTSTKIEAPPNSPNHIVDVGMHHGTGSLDSNNNMISSLLVEKLLEHQIAVGLLKNNDEVLLDQASQNVADASVELQKMTCETNGNVRNLRNNEKKATISGISGKVQKTSKPKTSPKNTKGQSNAEQQEHVLKVTSRFGRSISLKLPQF